LGLDGDVPDHSSYSKNRRGRFRGSAICSASCSGQPRRCIGEGLAGGDGSAVGLSLIQAEAKPPRLVQRAGCTACRFVRFVVEEYLAVLDDAAFGAASPPVLRSGFMADAGPAGPFERLSRAAGVMTPILIEGEAPAIERAASSCELVEHRRMRLDNRARGQPGVDAPTSQIPLASFRASADEKRSSVNATTCALDPP